MPVDLTPPPTRVQSRQSTAPRQTAQQKKAATLAGKEAERKEGLDGLVQLGVGVLMLTKQHADAAAVAEHGPNVTNELVNLSRTHEGVANAIDKLIAVGPYGALITALMPLSMQIAVNHGLIQHTQALAPIGVKPKELLEIEGKRSEMALQQQALEMQRRFAAEQEAFAQELAESMNGARPNGLPE